MKVPNFVIIFSILTITSCSKADKSDVDPPETPSNPDTLTINSDLQYSLRINGTNFSHSLGSQNFECFTAWSSSLAGPPDSSTVIFSSTMRVFSSPELGLSIFKGALKFSGTVVDSSLFISFITTGTIPYSIGPSDGIAINWVDDAGEVWATDNASGDQTGNTFEITDVKHLGLVSGNYKIKFKAKFSCKLYNSTGQLMSLTDGVYVGEFENYH